MSQGRTLFTAALAALTLSACATSTAPGPVEITRFHDASALAAKERGTFFIENGAGSNGDTLQNAPYKSAVAAELSRLGYTETQRGNATSIVQLTIDRYTLSPNGERRGPVSVGVGGSTGSYGSGVGLGIGINLGGGQRERIGTEMAVMIRDVASGQAVWEGRAQFEPARGTPQADVNTNAPIMAEALFRDFPGGNGETVEVEVP